MAHRIHRITSLRVYFLPVETRLPLKFGPETLTSVTCVRVGLRVADDRGQQAEGWGETPLSVQWVWPGPLPYSTRHAALQEFTRRLARAWVKFRCPGHPLEIGHEFQLFSLTGLWGGFNQERSKPQESSAAKPTGPPAPGSEEMPWLAALVANSPFDLALHDAFGRLAGRAVYATYNPDFLRRDLASFITPAEPAISFRGRYPRDYLLNNPPQRLRAWHLVGGLDLLELSELTGSEPKDGYPVVLTDWIERDGLKCLKVKLRGTDAAWDYDRLVRVGKIALTSRVEWLSADFNCTVQDPAYVNEILDHLRADHRPIWDRILYIEQPFPYELERHRIDVHSVASRKPLFLDESAHDWRMIRLGRELGWTGVALKTCKTQTGAILSACWAKAHGLSLMVQDLTNPMLAQIPHVLLAAHVGTIMGVETNAMQFYPAASAPEAKIHPGLYQRRGGELDLSTILGPGFGYRVEEIDRILPAPDVELSG